MANQTLDPLADADLPADYMPERADMAEAKAKERTFRTGVTNDIYFRLEKESVERGIKPYGLTQRVMTLYAMRKLVYVRDLPAELQTAIAAHYAAQPPLVI
ncbi:hypothetical protein [Methylomonas sp. DH-1]|uniref:hypothetical protein n=1 Tax=Methylomonas sp. (strain DH-1) TaxID=1727196 RepID=UPI0007C9629A|nr:hypothetical protein [Methylomonas sp. DH-1]ANE57480.1 hypothetical protein AYM39_21360 [Methylomonas sp. DH-1]